MPNVPAYCHETYMDALSWSAERRNNEVRGYAAFLSDNAHRLTDADVQAVLKEMRAVKLAIRHDDEEREANRYKEPLACPSCGTMVRWNGYTSTCGSCGLTF